VRILSTKAVSAVFVRRAKTAGLRDRFSAKFARSLPGPSIY
jgi:hypothetical protein